jgi:putative oxidoreductase
VIARLERFAKHPALGALCRIIVGGIFVWAGFPKLFRPDDVARLVSGYRVLHPDLLPLAGVIMPWVEVLAGALLVLGILPRSAALILAVLLMVFMGAGTLALLRGLEISCGCFFPFMGDHTLGWDLLIRDGLLLALSLQPLAWPSSFVPCMRGKA